MDIRFEWDPNKAASNLRKHAISFDLAMRAFGDPFALVEQDRIEGSEQRWRTLGMVDGMVLLVVAHTVEDEQNAQVIRIISARRAEPRERRRYAQANREAGG